MPQMNRVGNLKRTSDGSLNGEAVTESLRALWQAVDHAETVNRNKYKKEIAQAVARLRSRIERQLLSQTDKQPATLLFDAPSVIRDASTGDSSPVRRFPDPQLRVYGKDLAEHALKHIPRLTACKSITDIRKYLTNGLRFNSEATRRRNANYLISRYFPGKVVHSDVAPFAAAVEGTPALGDALFYLTARTERIVALVADEVVFPSLALGGVSRTKIRDFIQSQLPDSKSASQSGVSVVGTYQTFGVATATRTKLNVSLREGSLAAFAYILHLEFPEPGMHSFERLTEGPMHKWLLWDQQWIVRQLYRLREAGLLSKVSEIDRMRQFTTKLSLAEAVTPIVALAEKSPT